MNPSHGNRRFVAVLAAAIFAALAQGDAVRGSDMSPSRETGRILLAGGQDVLWVVRGGEGEAAGKFDLIIRRPGGKWRTLKRFSGSPAAVVARDRRLHVVSGGATPSTSVFSLSDDDKMLLRGMGPGARWPLRNPPAAICPAPPLGRSASPGFIAVVPHERDKLATATAASRPDRKRSGLTILQTVEGQWEPLSEIDDVPGAVGARISAAAAGDWVYVLVVGKDETTRLVAWNATDKKPTWKDVALPDKPRRPLSVSVLWNQPVLVTIAPAATLNPAPGDDTPPKATGIRLYLRELKAATIATDPQSIRHQAGPLILPIGPAPLACSLGEVSESQLALLWREKESYRFALVDHTGEVVENKEVEELLKSAPTFNTREIIDYFLLAIPALLLVFILFGRRKRPTGPMILPAQFIPGALPKRLVAMIIDWVPFSLLGILVLKVISPDLTIEDITAAFMAEQQNIPVEPVLCMLGSLAAWVIYGSIMESRFGATLGKMAMRLEVTSADGKGPTIRQAILRNLIRPIELSWPIIIFTMAVPLLMRTRQRLGDIMARTVVVEKVRSLNSDDSQKPREEPPA